MTSAESMPPATADGSADRPPPRVTVIDYGMSNLRSVCRAWSHVGAAVTLVNRPQDVGDPEALVFPGQGAITDCMALLRETGFDRLIRDWIAEDRPFFGICLGLQALFEHSEEGDCAGLGIFPGRVVRFRLPREYKVPHMGWNSVRFGGDRGMLRGIASGRDQFYFVHSYHVVPESPDLAWGRTDYGGPFVSAIARGSLVATQFHPEKSQQKGLRLYGNFLESLCRRR